MKNVLIYLSIIACIAFGWFLCSRFTPKCPETRADAVKIVKLDTIRFIIPPKYKDTGSIRYKDTGKIVYYSLKSKFDSLKIFKAFFQINPYNRIIVDDSSLFVSLTDSVEQNQLISGTGKYVIKKPTQIIYNNPVVIPTRQLYIKTGFGANLSDGFVVNGGLLLKDKKDRVWGLECLYEPMLSKKPMVMFSRSFNIQF